MDATSVVWRIDALQDLELLKASYTTHRFPRHYHDTYVIEVVERGTNAFTCDGRDYIASGGDILLINPGEVHTGHSVGGCLLKYRCFYPEPEHFPAEDDRPPLFRKHVVYDPLLWAQLLQIHRALENERDPLTVQSLVLSAWSSLIGRYSDRQTQPFSGSPSKPAIQRAREYMLDHHSRKLELRELSEVAGLSPYHFLRAFRKEFGMAPAEYLRNYRIDRARKLLRTGMQISSVAAATGFVDQSHLNRHFKRILGITPGQYRAILYKTNP